MSDRDLGNVLDEVVTPPDVDVAWDALHGRLRTVARRRAFARTGVAAVVVAGIIAAIAVTSSSNQRTIVQTPTSTTVPAPRHLAVGTWKQLPPGPLSPRNGAAVVWSGSQFVAYGGYDSHLEQNVLHPDAPTPPTVLDDLATYDPATKRWSTPLKAPLALDTPYAFRISNGVVGFIGENGKAFAYFVETRDFGVLASAGHAISGTFTQGPDGIVWNATAGVYYDPAHDRWHTMATPPLPIRNGIGTTAVLATAAIGEGDTQVVMIGSAGAYAYNAATDHWRTVALDHLNGDVAITFVDRHIVAIDSDNVVRTLGLHDTKWTTAGTVPVNNGDCIGQLASGDGWIAYGVCTDVLVAQTGGVTLHWKRAGTRVSVLIPAGNQVLGWGAPSDVMGAPTEPALQALALTLR
ncbi:MAG TPA: hypothetical protein VFR41_05155 [Acidimicrobiia bacterium]|nr:hypothetical protein [Acidimicrobiia bacterium]